MAHHLIEIKAKFAKGDRLFYLDEGGDGKPHCLIPVDIGGVANVKFLCTDMKLIRYSASVVGKNINMEVPEENLYSAEEIARFLK